MGDMERSITGEFALCNNPGCARTFQDHERRIRDLEKDKTVEELRTQIGTALQTLENLKGRLAGYMFAGALLGTIVGAMASVLASKM
jgi:hypothetical protein